MNIMLFLPWTSEETELILNDNEITFRNIFENIKRNKELRDIITKPGKDPTIPSSYRPISLLSCLFKLLEKCLLTPIIPFLAAHNVIPAHKFGFRQNYGTIEQVNRITSEICTAFEHREYCRAIFLDVSQAFDRVWLDGLMHKIKHNCLIAPQITWFLFLQQSLRSKVRHNNIRRLDYRSWNPARKRTRAYSVRPIHSGYSRNEQLTTSTIADDTAVLTRSMCPGRATTQLATRQSAVGWHV